MSASVGIVAFVASVSEACDAGSSPTEEVESVFVGCGCEFGLGTGSPFEDAGPIVRSSLAADDEKNESLGGVGVTLGSTDLLPKGNSSSALLKDSVSVAIDIMCSRLVYQEVRLLFGKVVC